MSYNTCDACTPCAPAPEKPTVSGMTRDLTRILADINSEIISILGLVSNECRTKEPMPEPCCMAENAFINVNIAKDILENVLILKESL